MSESIYNLVPQEYIAPAKQPIFRSKFDPDASFAGSTFGKEDFEPDFEHFHFTADANQFKFP